MFFMFATDLQETSLHLGRRVSFNLSTEMRHHLIDDFSLEEGSWSNMRKLEATANLLEHFSHGDLRYSYDKKISLFLWGVVNYDSLDLEEIESFIGLWKSLTKEQQDIFLQSSEVNVQKITHTLEAWNWVRHIAEILDEETMKHYRVLHEHFVKHYESWSNLFLDENERHWDKIGVGFQFLKKNKMLSEAFSHADTKCAHKVLKLSGEIAELSLPLSHKLQIFQATKRFHFDSKPQIEVIQLLAHLISDGIELNPLSERFSMDENFLMIVWGFSDNIRFDELIEGWANLSDKLKSVLVKSANSELQEWAKELHLWSYINMVVGPTEITEILSGTCHTKRAQTLRSLHEHSVSPMLWKKAWRRQSPFINVLKRIILDYTADDILSFNHRTQDFVKDVFEKTEEILRQEEKYEKKGCRCGGCIVA